MHAFVKLLPQSKHQSSPFVFILFLCLFRFVIFTSVLVLVRTFHITPISSYISQGVYNCAVDCQCESPETVILFEEKRRKLFCTLIFAIKYWI